MAIVSKLKFAGLQIANNEFSAAPDGALVDAKNVVIKGRDVLEPRRGQYERGATYTALTGQPNEVFFYRDAILTHYDSGSLATDTGVVFVDYEDEDGSTTAFTPPDPNVLRTKGAEAGLNFYFTTNRGVYAIDTPSTVSPTAHLAGVEKAPDIILAQIGNVVGYAETAIGPEQRVAYRVVFGERDVNGTDRLGAPSGRILLENTSAVDTKNALVTVAYPTEYSTSHFIRLYRTQSVDLLDGEGNAQDPGEEFFLVQEAFFTATDVSSPEPEGYTFLDTTPNGFLGVALYTNPNTGEGVLQANDPPPLCKDLAFWNNRMWYANSTQPHRFNLSFIGAPRRGDVITVDGNDYLWIQDGVGTDPTVIGYDGVIEETAGTVGEQVEAGARGLVREINQGSTTTGLRAYYVSGPDDAPGAVTIERVLASDAEFEVTYAPANLEVYKLSRTANVTTAWLRLSVSASVFSVGDTVDVISDSNHASFPDVTGATVISTTVGFEDPVTYVEITYADTGADASLYPAVGQYFGQRTFPLTDFNPVLSETAIASTSEYTPHRVHYSKLQQAEAVPALNYLDVGQPGKPILRIIPLRDKLFVFKPEGIFIVSGEAPFRVDLLDDTVRLLAADSAVAVSNQIHCLTNQGVVAVSDGGVAIVSGPVEPEIRRLLRDGFLTVSAKDIFGVSHESDHLYTLWVPEETGEQPTKAWVYNTGNGTWVNWYLPRRCGRVNPADDILHMGVHSTFTLARERKDYANTDFADNQFEPGAGTYDSSAGTVSWPAPVDVDAGDWLVDNGSFGNALVTEVVSDASPYVVSVLVSEQPAPGAYETEPVAHKAFESVVAWKTVDGGDPTQTKHFRDLNVHFRAKGNHRSYTVSCYTDFDSTPSSVERVDSDYEVFSEALEWGPYRAPEHDRFHVPQQHQRATYLHVTYTVQEAAADWALNGISLAFETNSERNKK